MYNYMSNRMTVFLRNDLLPYRSTLASILAEVAPWSAEGMQPSGAAAAAVNCLARSFGWSIAETAKTLSPDNLQFGGTPQLRQAVMSVARTAQQASVITEMIDALVAVGAPPELIERATLELIERTEPRSLAR